MDLAAIEPGLLDLAAALTGVPRAFCLWENAPRVQHRGQLVLLRWVSEVAAGVDAVTYAYAANVDPLLEMTPTVSGNRVVVVQLDVEVYSQAPGVNAHALVSRARTRLYWPSALAQLEALELALVGAEQVVVTDYEVDGHMVSRRTMDVRLNAVSRETDAAGATSYIATVQTVAAITHPDGSPVAASIAPGGDLP
jgi:hypothetical protein